jgi:hypothetical protein
MRMMLALLLLWGSCFASVRAQSAGPPHVTVQFPAGVNAVDLPARFDKENIEVRATIGSTSTYLALDSGASTNYLDTAFALKLGLTLTNKHSYNNGTYTVYSAVIPELDVGPLQMHDVPVSVGPMPQGMVGTPNGLLGNPFISQLGVTIDYWNEQVHVVPAGSFVPPAAPLMFVLDVSMRSDEPMVTVSIGNDVANNMIVDTGCACQLVFFKSFSDHHMGAFRYFKGTGAGTSVYGLSADKYYQLYDVNITNLHFQDFIATLQDRSMGGSDGLIGNELLSLFTVSFDYADGKIYLVPTDATKRGIAPKH